MAVANSAMTPLYGIGDDTWWLAYVLLTYILELSFISRFYKVSPLRAAYVALVANLFSSILGCLVCSLWMGGLGTANPLIEGIKILCVGAVVSGIFEAGVWQMILEPRLKGLATKEFLRPSLIVHGLGVVLGVILLLAQPRPFLGAAQNFNRGKRVRLISELKKALEMYTETNDAMPPGSDVKSWFKAFGENSKKPIAIPEFVRFDRLGRRTIFDPGLAVNPQAVGRPFKELAEKEEWVIEWVWPSTTRFYARSDGHWHFTTRREWADKSASGKRK